MVLNALKMYFIPYDVIVHNTKKCMYMYGVRL